MNRVSTGGNYSSVLTNIMAAQQGQMDAGDRVATEVALARHEEQDSPAAPDVGVVRAFSPQVHRSSLRLTLCGRSPPTKCRWIHASMRPTVGAFHSW